MVKGCVRPVGKLVDEKVIFITGAASGIGLEIAASFAREGAKIVISDLDEHQAKVSARQLQNRGFTALGLGCNVIEEEQIKSAIDQTLAQFGRLDVLINNAGLQYVSPLEDFPTEKFELLIKVMLTAPFIATKHVFPIMKNQQFGRIINMASINGLVGFAGKAAYNSAKHGVIGLTKVARWKGHLMV
jgi:3-hydroxybutyrate dehydrogenase